MSREKTRKFIGRAIVLDPKTGEDSEYSTYVCMLLTGEVPRPSATICEAKNVDLLLAKIKASGLYVKFRDARVTYDPPTGVYAIGKSRARQRYEALTLDELTLVQRVLSGR